MSIAATLSLNLPAITALCIGTRGSQIWSGYGPAATGASSFQVLSGDYYVDRNTGNYYGPYTTTWATSALFTLSFPQTAIPFTIYNSNSSLVVPVYNVNNTILSGSNYSIIFSGQTNTLSGSNLIIFGGLNNALTGSNSFVLGSNIIAGSAIDFTFVNNLSSTNNIFASNNITALNSVFVNGGNSNQWNNSYTTVKNTSANWSNVFTSVNNTSANWNNSYSTLTANSGTWVTYTALTNVSGNWQNTYTNVNSNSANWNSSYSTLTANSGTWVTYTALTNVSGNWQNTYTNVNSNSANWNSTYTTVTGNSATWYNTYTTVQTYSAGWSSVTSASAATYTLNTNNSLLPIKGSNTAFGTYSNIGGGTNNANCANCSVIGGGAYNATYTGNAYASIGGGLGLSAYGNFSHIGGGQNNCISTGGGSSSILGGNSNCVSGLGSTVVGGMSNSASGVYSYVAGGSGNTVTANNAFILGNNITATNPNTTYINNLSATANAYIGGKIGVGTTTATSTLAIAGLGQSYNNAPGLPLSSINTSGSLGNAITVGDTGTAVGNGGTILFQANAAPAGAGPAPWNFAAIHGNVTNGGGNSQGDIGFYTRTSSTDAVLSGIPLYILGGANFVGIGTQTPNVALTVVGAISATGSITTKSSATVGNGLTVSSGTASLQGGATVSSGLTVSTGGLTVSNGTASLPQTTTSGITSNAASYFNGNVGIFKSNPAYPLDVVGSIQIAGGNAVTGSTGTFYANDQSTTGYAAISRNAGITNFYDSVYGTGSPIISYTTTGSVGIKGSPGTGVTFDVTGNTRSSTGYLIGTNGGTSGHYLYDAGAGSIGLRAYGPGGTTYFSFNSSGTFSASNGGGYFNGNVGIGTPSPSSPLHVFNTLGAGGNVAPSLTYGSAATTIINAGYQDIAFGSANTASPYAAWLQTRTNLNNAGVFSINPLGGSVGIGTLTPNSTLSVNGTISASSALGMYSNNLLLQGDGSNAYIRPTNNGGSLYLGPYNNNLLNLNTNGNVGIGGVSSPGYQLDINAGNTGSTAGSQTSGIRISVTDANVDQLLITNTRAINGSDWGTAGWRIQEKVDATWMNYIQLNAGTIGSSTNAGISFGTGTSTVSPISIPEVMRITTSGNVGIGTTNPGATLTVNGAISASFGTTIGTLTAQNLITNGNEVVFSDGVGTNDTGNGANTVSLNYTNGTYVGLSGSGQLYALGVPRYTYLNAQATPIGPGLAAFFTAAPTDSLFGAGVYEIEAFLVFLKTTAGTLSAVFNGTSSFAATTELHINTTITPTGSLLTTTVGESYVSQNSNGSNNAPLGVSATLANGSFYGVRIKALLQNLTGATNNVGIYLLQSAGTLTPQNGSYRKITRVA